MHFTFNIFLLIFSFGLLQAFLLSVVLLAKRNRPRHSLYFALLLLVFSLASLKIILQEVAPEVLQAFPAPLLYQFASGPLLYLFARELLFKEATRLRNIWLHFIPALLFDVLYRVGFSWFGYQNSNSAIQLLNFATNIAAVLSCLIYLGLSARLYKQFRPITKSQQQIALWMKRLLLADALSTLAAILYIALTIYNGGFMFGGVRTYYVSYAALTLYIYFLGWMCYALPHIRVLKPTKKDIHQYAAPHVKTIRDEIDTLMHKEKLYQDPDLNLNLLADKIRLPPRELSEMLNQQFGENFNSFVNRYRVMSFIEMLKQNDANLYTIEGLALEAGFKSKASFYRAFKKETGHTPLQYVEILQKNLVK
ncbi:helix-turn-helix domain-containing protein [Pontibacter oryzae]|nr:helix-turn-helix domain-containing protein [Pontibacter oryzae]